MYNWLNLEFRTETYCLKESFLFKSLLQRQTSTTRITLHYAKKFYQLSKIAIQAKQIRHCFQRSEVTYFPREGEKLGTEEVYNRIQKASIRMNYHILYGIQVLLDQSTSLVGLCIFKSCLCTFFCFLIKKRQPYQPINKTKYEVICANAETP